MLSDEDFFRVEVTLRRPEVEDRLLRQISSLRSDISDLFREIDSLRSQLRETESRLAFELQVNLQLTDLLRHHGIPFRSSLDRRKSK